MPVGIGNIHWKMFLIFGVFNLSYIPIVYFIFPETAGFSLEAVDLCFMDRDKGPVAKANELYQAIKRGQVVHLSDEIHGKLEEPVHVEISEKN